jgi:hypothetical protein
MIQIFDCEQGTPEWKAARLGIPTASEFATVMRTKGKAADGSSKERRTYIHKLIGEILTGEPAESYSNPHMERGKVMEDEARDFYALQTNTDPERVGFIRNGHKGASPDSLIGKSGGLEIKTALPHIQIERLLRNELPSEHVAQVQGNLWVSEREFWDFVSYWPKLPLFVKRVYRDEAFIKELSGAVDHFNGELQQTLERIRRYGQAPEKRTEELKILLAAG